MRRLAVHRARRVGTAAPCSARAPRQCRSRLSRGFTLVEILVVVAILAIAAGVALATLDRDVRGGAMREARRFGGALEYAAARAQARAETLGVRAEGRQLAFWRRSPDTDTWTLITDDDVLAARTLDDPLQARALAYAGASLAPGTLVPLRPSGRNDPATFAIGAGDVQVTVGLDPLNRVTVANVTATP
jgi:general secretion pathway protein H